MEFEVISYNLHKGLAAGNRRFVLPDIRAALREHSASLLFLQEVLGKHQERRPLIKGWKNLEQHCYLAGSEWPYTAYEPNASYTAGHHGNALLSTAAIVEREHTDVSLNRFERRGVLRCRVAFPAGIELSCFCVHLDLRLKTRLKQLVMLQEILAASTTREEPILLCGDFNDSFKHASGALSELGLQDAHRSLHGTYAKSFPSLYPLFPLDRIYFRGLELVDATVLRGVPWSNLSDHCPLIARFAIK